MVRSFFAVSALNRKLLRDVWDMKGQAFAIAAVIAAGVTMYVTYLSNFDSLQRTRAGYYERERFADVFASLVRAPQSIGSRIAQVPGVGVLVTRVVSDVTLDVPGLTEPASGRLISIPEDREPPLNGVYLRRGRWIDPARPDEVIASEMFCEANRLQPGDRIAAVINGRKRWLTIAGIGLSPEYVYAVKPGDIVPDQRRYGVLWMGRTALEAAFDMEGSFNDVSLTLDPTASEPDVIASLDRLLEPYGGLGAIPRRLQTSAWTLDNELVQLQTFGFLMPAIFLSVAAFILNVALTRALAIQRPQIASLKALGYSNRELAWHYIKWALIIAAAGALAGVFAGARLGAGMINLYNQYFRFPFLDYHLSTDVALASFAGSLVVAALGAYTTVSRAVRVPPAEAMRPEAPTRYRPSQMERGWLRAHFTLSMRMVIRNIERQPTRTLLSVVGISFAVAVLLVGLSFIDIMDRLIDNQFAQTMRQDATVTFVHPRSARALHDVAHFPGAMDVEPMRTVPVRLRSGARSRTLAVLGLNAVPRLNRVMTRDGRPVTVPAEGLVLSRKLGEILALREGDRVRVEVLEGRHSTWDVPIASLVDDSLGLQAYMRIDALRRAMREGAVVSGAFLTVDPAALDAFYRDVKGVPAVAGVALRDVTLQNFRDTMAQNMNVQVFFNVLFAGIIAFGVVYNSARVSLSERTRELASLRVLGFTRAEISLILLGELAVLTTLALPVGALLGMSLGHLIMLAFDNELYRLSFAVAPRTVALAFLTVIGAAFLSGLVVRRRLDTLDLVAVLKIPE